MRFADLTVSDFDSCTQFVELVVVCGPATLLVQAVLPHREAVRAGADIEYWNQPSDVIIRIHSIQVWSYW